MEELAEEQRVQEKGTMDEIYGEYSLLDLKELTVVPPVIQKFLDKREVERSDGSVVFVVR